MNIKRNIGVCLLCVAACVSSILLQHYLVHDKMRVLLKHICFVHHAKHSNKQHTKKLKIKWERAQIKDTNVFSIYSMILHEKSVFVFVFDWMSCYYLSLNKKISVSTSSSSFIFNISCMYLWSKSYIYKPIFTWWYRILE